MQKHSNIFFYKNLVPFLNDHFRDIQLRSEQEKQELISKLTHSPNFLSTHGVIAMMCKYDGWTESQIEDICLAAETNSQVGWILGDTDVLDFYSRLLSRVKYEDLSDCATSRVMETVFVSVSQREAETEADYKAEADEAAEEFFRH